MSVLKNEHTRRDNPTNERNTLVDSVRILSDITRRDIEKSIPNKHNYADSSVNQYSLPLQKNINTYL